MIDSFNRIEISGRESTLPIRSKNHSGKDFKSIYQNVRVQGISCSLTVNCNLSYLSIKQHNRASIIVIDRVLSVLQISNSFANCFIYAKMHQQVSGLRRSGATNVLRRSRHSNMYINMPNKKLTPPLSHTTCVSVLSSNEEVNSSQTVPLTVIKKTFSQTNFQHLWTTFNIYEQFFLLNSTQYPIKHTTSFQRCGRPNNVVTTQNDVMCLLGITIVSHGSDVDKI